jgi:hypothetical protein
MEEHAFQSHNLNYRARVGPASDFAGEAQSILMFLIPRAHVRSTTCASMFHSLSYSP